MDEDFQQLVTVRFNEMMADGAFSAIQFAQEQLAVCGFNSGDAKKLVGDLLWQILHSQEAKPERMPRPKDVANAEAFREYFHEQVARVVDAMVASRMVERTGCDPRCRHTFICSGCLSEHRRAAIHVIPTWNEHVQDFVTTYRCDKCWSDSLAWTRLKAVVLTAEVREKLCQFLERHGCQEATEVIRQASLEEAAGQVGLVIDGLEEGRLVLEP